jgi:hypothetical protein
MTSEYKAVQIGIYFSAWKYRLFTVWSRKQKLKLSHYTPRWRIAPHSLPRRWRGQWSASRPGRALAQGKGPTVPIVQEAEWAPVPVLTHKLEENPFAPAGDRTYIARSSSP